MRTHPVEAGTRLAGRFVLIDALAASPSSDGADAVPRSVDAERETSAEKGTGQSVTAAQWWRAHDEILARTVAVRLVHNGPKAARELSAARNAARVTDPRVVRVLDVGTSDDLSYVVTEWCEGDDLASALQNTGPLSAAAARRLAGLTAQALAAAEDSGLAVPELGPRDIRLVADGSLRVAGLERPWQTSVESDSWGARISGAVLYAALTARWPLSLCDGLAPAPVEAGVPIASRQVRAGLPAELDVIAGRALGLPGRHAPFTTAAEVADALAVRPLELSLDTDETGDDLHDPHPARSVENSESDDVVAMLAVPPGPSRAARAVRAGAVTLLTVGVGLAVWQGVSLVRSVATSVIDGNSPVTRPRPTTAPAPSPSAVVPLVTSFDPLPQGSGDEHPEQVGRVLDRDPGTSWTSYTYTTPALGGLKTGVGLLLDLGSSQRVSQVGIELPGAAGDVGGATGGAAGAADDAAADVAVYGYGELPTRSPTGAPAATAAGVRGRVTLTPDAGLTARWVLIWFTKLPPTATGFQAQVAEVTVSVLPGG